MAFSGRRAFSGPRVFPGSMTCSPPTGSCGWRARSRATFWVEGVFWADGTFRVEHIPWDDLYVGTSGMLWAEGADTMEGDGGSILGGDR